MKIQVTEEDAAAARAVGAKGHEVVEFAIHRALDEAGIPREGRSVSVTKETIEIQLPPGYDIPEDAAE
jgi:hypothetical protein